VPMIVGSIPHRSKAPAWHLGHLFVAGLAVLACGTQDDHPNVASDSSASDTVRGSPAPKFTTPFDSISTDSLLEYVGGLEWDEREGAGDMQRLMLGACPNNCQYGPRVVIQPERRSHQNSSNSLSQAPGRIIARFINLDAQAYPKLNIAAHDTVYWAVERVQPVNDSLSRGRSLFISTKKLRMMQPAAEPESLLVTEHPSGYWAQALARWIWSETDETRWGTCKEGGCCH